MPGKPPPPPRGKPDGSYHRPRREVVVEEYDDTQTPPSLKRADLPPPPSHPEHAKPVKVERGPDVSHSMFKLPVPAWVKLGGQKTIFVFALTLLLKVCFEGAKDLLETWNRPVRAAQDMELRAQVKRLTKSNDQIVVYLNGEYRTTMRQHEILGAVICKLNGGPPHTTFPCGEQDPHSSDPDFFVEFKPEPLNPRVNGTYQLQTSFPVVRSPGLKRTVELMVSEED